MRKYHNILNILKAFTNLNKERNFNHKLVLVMQILDRKYYKTLKIIYFKENLEKSVQIFENLDREYLLIYINLQVCIYLPLIQKSLD